MTRPTPTAELPPRATWSELFALGWRRGWFSLKPKTEPDGETQVPRDKRRIEKEEAT